MRTWVVGTVIVVLLLLGIGFSLFLQMPMELTPEIMAGLPVPEGVSVSGSEDLYQETRVGQYVFTVKNTAKEAYSKPSQTFVMTVTGDWITKHDIPPNVTLQSQEARTFTVTVTIPEGTPRGAFTEIHVVARGTNHSSLVDSATRRVYNGQGEN